MAGRRPGVEGPETGEDREADEHQRERPILELFGERILRQFKQTHRLRAGDNIRRDDADEHHRAADE